MTVEAALSLLAEGEGVWIRGAPGSGRSHTLQQIAARWSDHVLWAQRERLDALQTVSAGVLLCIDDAPAGLCRADLPTGGPVIATGPRPGSGWTFLELPPLPEEESVRLFLRHAPEAAALPKVRALVKRLSGNPTAIIATARRWPGESIAAILLDPSPEWPALRTAYDALGRDEQETLALLSRLPGAARWEGLVWCGRASSVERLVTAGWVTVVRPGHYQLPTVLMDRVRSWRAGDASPYFAWFAGEMREQLEQRFTGRAQHGWVRSGLWPALYETGRYHHEEWFFFGWALSAESPRALLAALDAEGEALSPVIKGYCAARAHSMLGQKEQALEAIEAGLAAGDPARPRWVAWATFDLAFHRFQVRKNTPDGDAFVDALRLLKEQEMHYLRVSCLSNFAVWHESCGRLDEAQMHIQTALAEGAALNIPGVMSLMSSNLGLSLMLKGDMPAARATLQRALEYHAATDPGLSQRKQLASIRANQAALEVLEGHLDAADTRCQEALEALGDQVPSRRAVNLARRSGIAALRGALDDARRYHTLAEQALPHGDSYTPRIVALWRAFLEWQVGDRASALGRRRAALTGAPPLVDISTEARLVIRLLEQLMRQPGEVLLVGPEGMWFRLPGKPRVSVARYSTVTRVLARLAQQAQNKPGSFCTPDDLITAGWPNERITPSAAKNRLAVTLSRLRKEGMREVLERAQDGWRFSPDFSVLLLQTDESPAEGDGA
ncbi:MAG: hypothetical protein AAFV53_09080 [Myxococcota bacterium]